MNIPSADLVSALDTLTIVPQRTGVTQSEYVKIVSDKKRLRMFLSSEVKAAVTLTPAEQDPEGFEFYIERNLLVPFINASRNSPKAVFTIEPDGKTLLIKQGRRRARYNNTKAVDGYYDAGAKMEGEKVAQFSSQTIQALKLVAKYADRTNTRPDLQGVGMSKKYAYVGATDSHTLIVADCSEVKFSHPIPILFPDLMTPECKLAVSTLGARLDFAHGSVYHDLIAQTVSDFPYQRLREAMDEGFKLPIIAEVTAGKFTDLLARIRSYIASFITDTTGVWLTAKAGKPQMTAKVSANMGAFSESMKPSMLLEAGFNMEIKLISLLPFFEQLPRDVKVRLHWAENQPCYVHAPKTGIHFLATSLQKGPGKK